MARSFRIGLTTLALLLPSSTAAASDFADFSMSFSGCASLQGGELTLQVCGGCPDLARATLIAPLPGRFVVDMHYEATSEFWADLTISTASGTSSFASFPACSPCSGGTSGIVIDVEASDVVTFQLYRSAFSCIFVDPITVTLSNLQFVPAVGISTLGGALDASALLEIETGAPSTTTAVGPVVMLDDVDGDGRPDLGCALPGIDSPDPRGRVQVWSGATGAVLHEWLGTSTGSQLGSSLGNAGDVDGDGFDDLVAAQQSPLMVRVFSAATGTELFTITSVAAPGPYAVDGAGDVDGDGRGDIVVGACFADRPGAVNCGKVQVYSGGTQALLHEASGDFGSDQLGFVVAGAGDVDGDGFDDYLATATFYDFGDGLVRIYSGLTGLPLNSFVGWSGSEQLGMRADGAGDFDGDGQADIIAAGSAAFGAVRVYSVASTSIDPLFVAPVGAHVAGAGDLNGDGFDDVLVASTVANAHLGVVRAYGGPAGALLFELMPLDFTSYASLAGGRDVNGDGAPDFVVQGEDILGTHRLFVLSGLGQSHDPPVLSAMGALTPASPLTVKLTHGPPSASAFFVVSLEPLYLPFKGGFMLPFPTSIVGPLPLGPTGGLQFGTTWPAQLVAPFAVVLQAWMPTPAALHGFVASNGLLLAPP